FDAYTGKVGLNRLFLHAANIKFTHPGSEEKMDISAPMEKRLERALTGLRKL
ncbi:MAG TPA: RNA pseudouridine synthase, partial [Vibrio sp.]|nr:RNA pseudouridine synthase [Vibrio sp.]